MLEAVWRMRCLCAETFTRNNSERQKTIIGIRERERLWYVILTVLSCQARSSLGKYLRKQISGGGGDVASTESPGSAARLLTLLSTHSQTA